MREIERKESEALLAVTERLIDETRVDQRFTADDIQRMHRLWLGEIYVWAGEYRQLNVSKGGFMFAAASQRPRPMDQLERGPLSEYTPCSFAEPDERAAALAVVHAELILIHPFREGNGRCSRLLAILTGLQAGLPALDFVGIRGKKKTGYIAAIHAAVGRNYAPMAELFNSVVARTLKSMTKPSSR